MKKTTQRGKFISLEAINFALKPLQTSLVALLIVRLYTIELWGSFVFFLILSQFAISLLSWGQKPYLIRAFSSHPQNISENWYKASISRLPFLAPIAIILALLPSSRPYFQLLLVWIVFRWMGLLFESIIQFNRNYKHSIVAEISSLITAVTLILLLKNDMSLELLILVFAISSIIKFLILIPLLPNGFDSSYFKINSITKELANSSPFFALSILGMLQNKIDLYVGASLLNDEQLAIYQVTLGFLVLAQAIPFIILGPFQKNIYRWKSTNIIPLKKTLYQIGVPLTLFFSSCCYFILIFVYQFQISWWYIILYAAYILPLYSFLIESQILLKFKFEKTLIYTYGFSVLLTIPISLLLIFYMGIAGGLLSGLIIKLILASLLLRKFKSIQLLENPLNSK